MIIKEKNDIEILLDKNSSEPLYIQLFEQLKKLIISGIITEDYRLPPIRAFAAQLSVNNVTIVNAYRLLEDNKLIYKKAGSGTYVMPINEKISWEVETPLTSDDMDYGFEANNIDGMINFAAAAPDPGLFPIVDFKKVLNDVLERDGGSAFTYQDSQGYKPLRESISLHVQKYNNNIDADDIYIISGAQQGIDIISRVLLSNGDYVFVESPTYIGAAAVFRSRGAKIIEIPLMNDGPDMNELEKRLKLVRPKFIYVMPNFQNPTGCTYSERKRKHLMLLCRKYDVLLVEDDYLSDLSYLSIPTKPIKAYDNDDKVIYIKSFSKIFMPGLRVAYLIIPKYIRDMVMNAKYMTDISTSGFMQRVLDIYLRSNIWDRHIAYMKREYSIRYYEAVRAVKKYLRGASFIQPNGGLNLWIKLPDEIDSCELFDNCRKEKVLIMPGTSFLNNEEGRKYMRLSFAAASPEKIIEGISIVGQVIEDMKSRFRVDNK